MEQNHQSYLATEGIGKLMGKYAVPCIISLLVGALYNIVDQVLLPTHRSLDLMEMRPIPPYFRLR